MSWRPHPILARRLGQAPFICKKWGKQEFSVAWSRLHETTPDAFFVFPSPLSDHLLFPSLLSSNTPIFSPAAASFQMSPIRTLRREQMSSPAHLKAISFAELYGFFFAPEAGSVWTHHLGDKLCLILSSQKKRERKKKEVESNYLEENDKLPFRS